jgi:hypothetical protein
MASNLVPTRVHSPEHLDVSISRIGNVTVLWVVAVDEEGGLGSVPLQYIQQGWCEL